MKSRKGLLDTTIIPIFLLVGALLLVVASVISVMTVDAVNEMKDNGDVPADFAGRVESNLNHVPNVMRVVFVLGVFGLAVALLGLAYFTPSHPIFGFTVLATVLVGSYMGAYISNAWEEMRAESDGFLAQALSGQPEMTLLMANIPYYFIGVGVLCFIAFYAGVKQRGSNDLGGGAFG